VGGAGSLVVGGEGVNGTCCGFGAGGFGFGVVGVVVVVVVGAGAV